MRNVIKSEVQNCPMELQIFRGHLTSSTPRILSFLHGGLAKKIILINFFLFIQARREKKFDSVTLHMRCIAIFLDENPSLFQHFYFEGKASFNFACAKIQFSSVKKMRGLSILEHFQNGIPFLFRITMHTVLFSPVCVVNAFDSEVDLLMTYSTHFFHRLGD